MVCSLHSVTTGSRDRANVSLIIIIIIILVVYFLCFKKIFCWSIHICVPNATTGNFAYFCTNPSPAEHLYLLLLRSVVQQLYLFLGSCEYKEALKIFMV